MSNFYTTVLPFTDSQITDLFSSLETIFDTKATISFAGINQQTNLNDELITSSRSNSASKITTASIGKNGINIYYHRNHSSQNSSQNGHPYFSTIGYSVADNNQLDKKLYINVSNTVEEFISLNKLSPISSMLTGADGVGIQSAVLTAIQAAASDQISRTNEFFVEMTKRFAERHALLEAEAEAAKQALAAKHVENEKILQAQRDELIKATEALEQRRKELDDRDNTHARRATKLELLNTLQERQKSFSISADTKSLRWPIHFVFLLLLAGTFSGAFWTFYVWGNAPQTSWSDALTITGVVKSIFLTFAFLTSAGLYISWMNRWFDKHADAQFVTKQYEVDINRATWAVEAALEWQRLQGGEMPQALIDGITNHLFDRDKGESAEYSPLDALASSILGSAANMKINVGGNEVTLDRKSIKNIRK